MRSTSSECSRPTGVSRSFGSRRVHWERSRGHGKEIREHYPSPALARDHGIPAWVGGMLESSLGKSVNVELATLDNFVGYPHDIGPSSHSFKEDITDPVLEFPGQARSFEPSTVPGTPCRPSMEKVERLTRERFVVQ